MIVRIFCFLLVWAALLVGCYLVHAALDRLDRDREPELASGICFIIFSFIAGMIFMIFGWNV